MPPAQPAVKKPVSILTNTHWGPWKWQQRPVSVDWTLDDRVVVRSLTGDDLFDAHVRDIESARLLTSFLKLRSRDGRRVTVDVSFAAFPAPREDESVEDYTARGARSLPSDTWWRENLQAAGLDVPRLAFGAAVAIGTTACIALAVVIALLATF